MCALIPQVSLADPDKDDSGNGKPRRDRAEFKQEYWDGNCKVDSKLEKSC
jgi:hypothetical protein